MAQLHTFAKSRATDNSVSRINPIVSDRDYDPGYYEKVTLSCVSEMRSNQKCESKCLQNFSSYLTQ